MANALHTPGVVDSKAARLDDGGLLALQGPGALDVRTGVLVGPGSTALVTGTSSTSPMRYSVAPHHWVASRSAASGPYRGTLEATQLVDTTAAPGSGSRIDVIWSKQQDNTVGIPTPDATAAEQYGCTQGTATTGTPTKPSIPVGAVELATATVSAGATSTNGAGVVITNTARQTVARGAPIPVRSKSERDALTTFPGLSVRRLDRAAALEWHDGTRWRQDGDYTVITNEADVSTLDVYPGLQAYATATGARGVYDNGNWSWFDSRWQTYTPAISTAPAPFPEITYGNAERVGRYLRRGRAVDLAIFYRLGTTTSYGGNSGTIRFDYPPGLRPSDASYQSLMNCVSGGSYMNTSGGGRMGWVLHEYTATAANRRMFLVDVNSATIQGGSGTLNIDGVGRFAQFTTSYEIA